jgi:hypothetical protein
MDGDNRSFQAVSTLQLAHHGDILPFSEHHHGIGLASLA